MSGSSSRMCGSATRNPLPQFQVTKRMTKGIAYPTHRKGPMGGPPAGRFMVTTHADGGAVGMNVPSVLTSMDGNSASSGLSSFQIVQMRLR
jgi:hypothetical protein